MNETFGELLRRAQESGELRADLVLDDIPMFMCGIGMATRKPHRCPDAWRRHVDDRHRRPARLERLGAAALLVFGV